MSAINMKSTILLTLLAAAELVAGHGAIIAATGNAGGTGMALGIDTATPRDGTRRSPFQQDSTRFRGDAAETFGETLGGGDNQLEAGTAAIMAETGDSLPQVTPGGEVEMTLHQVNADGGGPYNCMINADGTGAQWTNIQVTTTPPGRNSRNRQGESTDFPLVAAIPENQQCTGEVAGQENVCLVRCQNDARAGPFGGVVPVQMVAEAGNATDPAVARRALALRVRSTELKLATLRKKVMAKRDHPDFDLTGLDADEIAELLEDGEISAV
ncbi:hypothetical protein QBC37DRAFT_371776 [Rhypophila decipiens]|uniref:Uncharacterized protein n=1 Tax=Rhypophila decipiens TaxID=261697 RepID=A0AAN6YBP4_9PEZI|nr:hypothetical protein QBC37DRAFT_371776 [Rhypophila decipiens]